MSPLVDVSAISPEELQFYRAGVQYFHTGKKIEDCPFQEEAHKELFQRGFLEAEAFSRIINELLPEVIDRINAVLLKFGAAIQTAVEGFTPLLTQLSSAILPLMEAVEKQATFEAPKEVWYETVFMCPEGKNAKKCPDCGGSEFVLNIDLDKAKCTACGHIEEL